MGAKRKLDYDCPIRDVLDRVGDAWTVLTILELSKSPCRFNALKRVIDGISQRMLAVTLRNLERDGLVSRRVLPSAPPHVEYSLTARGLSLHQAIGALNEWAVDHQSGIRADRLRYDQRPALV